MNIISNNKKNVNTFLKITFKCDISEDLGDLLPFPVKHSITNVFEYTWNIRGFFGTKKSIDFINDIKSRFLITYRDKIIKTELKQNTSFELVQELKEFQNLKSKTVEIINNTNRFDSNRDMVFWCLKLYTEKIISERGLIEFETLLEFGLKHFSKKSNNIKGKDYSTIKSKCRSIINYYINNDYKPFKDRQKSIKTKEEITMTRRENATKQHKKMKEDNIKKVKNFLSGMFYEDYKKPNGKWNISLISSTLKISRTTLYKIIEEENI